MCQGLRGSVFVFGGVRVVLYIARNDRIVDVFVKAMRLHKEVCL